MLLKFMSLDRSMVTKFAANPNFACFHQDCEFMELAY